MPGGTKVASDGKDSSLRKRNGLHVNSTSKCEHLAAVTTVKRPEALECDECVASGSSWVHLRTCQTCGVTRCCDSSPNRHATRHARSSGHPVVASAEQGERWLYCYVDEAFGRY